jgi:hypothetical protein
MLPSRGRGTHPGCAPARRHAGTRHSPPHLAAAAARRVEGQQARQQVHGHLARRAKAPEQCGRSVCVCVRVCVCVCGGARVVSAVGVSGGGVAVVWWRSTQRSAALCVCVCVCVVARGNTLPWTPVRRWPPRVWLCATRARCRPAETKRTPWRTSSPTTERTCRAPSAGSAATRGWARPRCSASWACR